jgi:asparagine synthase (glutamine-hydrolysing)
VGFAHRRLAIIDLTESGNQPMHYAEGRYTITYNGEIYNYIELRNELKKKGYNFVSQSDTEVILALFDCKRENCLSDLDGMFSFAIWDEKNQELFCARDRFGEKPFHYYFNGDTFLFASEIKALFAYGVERKINFKNLQHYLNSGENELCEETFFTDITKIRQGHYLILKEGKISLHKYYSLSIETKIEFATDNEYAEHFKHLLQLSIKRRLRSDVAVGTSLSGGIDSSAIVCNINTILGKNKNQKTFSARFDEPRIDEGKWIDLVVKKTLTDHYEVLLHHDDIIEVIDKVFFHHEYPIGSTSICAQYHVMKLARENGVKVLLDGQGADEIQAGYSSYFYYAFWEYLFNWQFKNFFNERIAYKNRYQKSLNLGYSFIPKQLLSKIFRPGNIDNGWYRSLKAKLRLDLSDQLSELLAYADRNSMAHGIETRLPFLFHELVEFSLHCPTSQIYRKATSKWMLRNSIKGIVPDPIISRTDKLSYTTPQEKWLPSLKKSQENSLFLYNLRPSQIEWRNYSASKFIESYS